jgi:putative transposase
LVQAERVRAGADGGLFGCDCDGLRGVGRDGDRHGQRVKGYRTKCGLDIRRGAWRLCRLEYPYEPDLLGRPNAKRSGCNDGCPNASLPPHIAVSDFVRRVKGCSSHRVRMEFPDLRMRYWGRHFWARGYFSTTSGNITDDVRLQYRQEHEPTGVSR